jgi:hypothetical protein
MRPRMKATRFFLRFSDDFDGSYPIGFFAVRSNII